MAIRELSTRPQLLLLRSGHPESIYVLRIALFLALGSAWVLCFWVKPPSKNRTT